MLRDPETGKLYDSKAIFGAAYGYAFPDEGPLHAEDFSGGEATVERVLQDLRFEVVRVGQDWTVTEVEATVKDYFDMLCLESTGTAYSKAEHNEQLQARLTTRSKSSIELKHQNISAVLDQLGLPYIRGYKPRSNLQELLRQTVLKYVDQNQQVLTKVMDGLDALTTPGERKFRGVLVEPPKVETLSPTIKRARLPRKLDYASREEYNRKLGHSGESWTVAFETTRLTDEGRPDLAAKKLALPTASNSFIAASTASGEVSLLTLIALCRCYRRAIDTTASASTQARRETQGLTERHILVDFSTELVLRVGDLSAKPVFAPASAMGCLLEGNALLCAPAPVVERPKTTRSRQ